MTSPVDESILEPLGTDDSDEELDWEEVQVPEQEQEHIEIVLQAQKGRGAPSKKKSTGINHAERVLRINCHKIHTVLLLMNARMRNKLLNDELLQARLLSLTPMSLQNSFSMIHSSRVPEQARRGRMFESAIVHLVEWWSTSFFEVTRYGHIRNRTFDHVQERLASFGFGPEAIPDLTIDEETLEDILDNDLETIRTEKSLMKHALMQSGSRDISAQLFTALCRALSIPTRLIVSLQSVPWQAGVGKPRPKYQKKSAKMKEKAKVVEEEADKSNEDDNEMVEVPISSELASSSKISTNGKLPTFPGAGSRIDGTPVEKSEKAKGKEKAKPQVKLRKPKPKGNTLGSKTAPSKAKPKHDDPLTTAPVFWTEVFSRPDSRWLPVDPIRGYVNKRHVFDPSSSPSSGPSTENRMVYVLAFEEDGYARDVTRRYAKEFGAKVAKMQGGSRSAGISGGGRGRLQWWEQVLGTVTRPFRLNRDDVEDDELETAQLMEGMPTTISGFKDHPLYVLVRHLKQNETIHPPPPATPELGKFRGESVYSRSSIVTLKTPENWLRSEGRTIREGAQPMKFVKMRASTVGRQREIELMKDGLKEAGEGVEPTGSGPNGELMQGLYARNQTEMFVPDPIVDGVVPKNQFGNIDLYIPSMLPRGAVHIPYKGVAKIARKLGLDYAEAVTGFEFRKRRATPVIEGVVVAAEHEALLLEAYWEAEQDAEEKARIKREERAIKRWTRLIHGLRIRQRLQEQYAKTLNAEADISASEERSTKTSVHKDEFHPGGSSTAGASGGGFLVGADDVVQAFRLPKVQNYDPLSVAATPKSGSAALDTPNGGGMERESSAPMEFMTYDEDEAVDVGHVVQASLKSPELDVVPRSMLELAKDSARTSASPGGAGSETEEIPDVMIAPSPSITKPAPPDSVSPQAPSVRRSTRTAGRGGSTPSRTQTQNGGKATRSSRRTTGGRKRRRGGENDENEEDEEVQNGADEGGKNSPSPAKRSRHSSKGVPTPPSTRTLRPRTRKTEAQLQKEQENEEAYRQAIAQ